MEAEVDGRRPVRSTDDAAIAKGGVRLGGERPEGGGTAFAGRGPRLQGLQEASGWAEPAPSFNAEVAMRPEMRGRRQVAHVTAGQSTSARRENASPVNRWCLAAIARQIRKRGVLECMPDRVRVGVPRMRLANSVFGGFDRFHAPFVPALEFVLGRPGAQIERAALATTQPGKLGGHAWAGTTLQSSPGRSLAPRG